MESWNVHKTYKRCSGADVSANIPQRMVLFRGMSTKLRMLGIPMSIHFPLE